MPFKIERRHNLSYAEFAQEFLYTQTPVILTGALEGWEALRRWTPDFFKQQFGTMAVSINATEYGQEGHGKTKPITLTMAQFVDQVMESTDENPAPYFRRSSIAAMFPSLVQDMKPLSYLQPNWLGDKFLVRRVQDVLGPGADTYIYIGGRGGSFPVLHYDGAGTHAFLMQIYGRKEYVLYPPDQERFLYPIAGKPNLSAVNVEKPDFEKYPLFRKAQPTIFTLEPGEILFVAAHWWHTVKMLTPSITVSQNLLNDSNWPELMKFVEIRAKNPLIALTGRMYLKLAGARRSWRDRGIKEELNLAK